MDKKRKKELQKEQLREITIKNLGAVVSWFIWAGLLTLATTLMDYHKYGFWFYFGVIIVVTVSLRIISYSWEGQ